MHPYGPCERPRGCSQFVPFGTAFPPSVIRGLHSKGDCKTDDEATYVDMLLDTGVAGLLDGLTRKLETRSGSAWSCPYSGR